MNVPNSKFRVPRQLQVPASFVLFGILTLAASAAQPTNSPARPEYGSFKIVYERNIFNSRRSPQYVAPERRDPTRRSTRTESFALVGTMNHGSGSMAFFEGSSSQYRKILKHDETIAGFKLAQIQQSSVKLASPTNEVELPIGMQLVREDEGPWRVSARPEVLEPRSTSSRSSYQASSNRTTLETSRQREADTQTNQNGFSDTGPLPFNPDTFIPPGLIDPQAQTQPVPTFNGNAPAPASGGEEDVLAILRRRREQENNP